MRIWQTSIQTITHRGAFEGDDTGCEPIPELVPLVVDPMLPNDGGDETKAVKNESIRAYSTSK
jgi:hypothetical protein